MQDGAYRVPMDIEEVVFLHRINNWWVQESFVKEGEDITVLEDFGYTLARLRLI